HLYEDNKVMNMKQVRKVMTFLFSCVMFIFLLDYLDRFGAKGLGLFLLFSAPLLFVLLVSVNRVTSMVIVKGKLFPLYPSLPYQGSGVNVLDGVVGLGFRMKIKGLPYYEYPFSRRVGSETSLYPIN